MPRFGALEIPTLTDGEGKRLSNPLEVAGPGGVDPFEETWQKVRDAR
jgi:hypothetical protein